jgi:hypothetical protein
LALLVIYREQSLEAQTRNIETFNPPRDSTNLVLLTLGIRHRNISYKYEVPRARIERLPDWAPTSNSIPLLPQQAAQMAVAHYRSLHPSVTNELEARSVSLERILWFESKWAYYVRLASVESSRPSVEPEDPKTIILLLDSTFVEPVIDRSPQGGRAIR